MATFRITQGEQYLHADVAWAQLYLNLGTDIAFLSCNLEPDEGFAVNKDSLVGS